MESSQNNKHLIKVIHCIWWIPHYRAAVFRQLSQNRDMEFAVCAGDNSEVWAGAKVASAEDTGKIDGINWRKVKSVRIKGPLFKYYEWQPDTVKIVWKEKLDAVVCLGNKSLSNWLIRIICKLRRIPLIEWGIGVMGPEKGLKWAVRKFYLKWPDAHLLYGQFARDWYASHGFKKESLFVIHNSLEYDKQVAIRETITSEDIQALRKSFGVTGPDDRLIFHTGRLEKKKNLTFLFDAIKKLKEKGRKVKLLVIGEGQEEKKLRDYVSEIKLGDMVIFYGGCYSESTLGKIISASDLCVVPGVVGLIAMHSLVYGTPILTRQNTAWLHGPEIDAVVDGKTGRYYRDGDLNDLVEKMESLLYPVSCKSQMSQACKEMIDKYYTPKYQERVFVQAVNYVLPPEKRIPVPD